MKKFRRTVVYEIEAADDDTAHEIWAESGPEIAEMSASYDGGMGVVDEGVIEEHLA